MVFDKFKDCVKDLFCNHLKDWDWIFTSDADFFVAMVPYAPLTVSVTFKRKGGKNAWCVTIVGNTHPPLCIKGGKPTKEAINQLVNDSKVLAGIYKRYALAV